MSEQIRLAGLCALRGIDDAQRWAIETRQRYVDAIRNPSHFASHPDWRPLFERSIVEFTVFIEEVRDEQPA